MKNLISYIVLIAALLSVSSCDFIRTVAGRPTSADLKARKAAMEMREKALKDSIALVQARARREAERAEAVAAIEEMGFKISDRFSFGTPVTVMDYENYAIIGVYRNSTVADRQVEYVSARGFIPGRLYFENGAQAVYIHASDNLKDIAQTLAEAKAKGACPKDSWVFTNR